MGYAEETICKTPPPVSMQFKVLIPPHPFKPVVDVIKLAYYPLILAITMENVSNFMQMNKLVINLSLVLLHHWLLEEKCTTMSSPHASYHHISLFLAQDFHL